MKPADTADDDRWTIEDVTQFGFEYERLASIAEFLEVDLRRPDPFEDSQPVPDEETPEISPISEAQRLRVLQLLPADPESIVSEHVEWRRHSDLQLIRYLVVKLQDRREFALFVDDMGFTPSLQILKAISEEQYDDQDIEDVVSWMTVAIGEGGPASKSFSRQRELFERGVQPLAARFLVCSLLDAYLRGEVDYEGTIRWADKLGPALQVMLSREHAEHNRDAVDSGWPEFVLVPSRDWLRNTVIELMRGRTPRTLNSRKPPHPSWVRSLAVTWIVYFERLGTSTTGAVEEAQYHLSQLTGSAPAVKTLHSWYLEERKASGCARRRGRPPSTR
jgi:hypothetical protein